MSLTTHIGYGPFQLCDFKLGDIYARFDGSLARICDPQPPGRPDNILVWVNYNTNNARKEWLHKSAQAFAISEDRGWEIAQERKDGQT